jgi:hypothetical protein
MACKLEGFPSPKWAHRLRTSASSSGLGPLFISRASSRHYRGLGLNQHPSLELRAWPPVHEPGLKPALSWARPQPAPQPRAPGFVGLAWAITPASSTGLRGLGPLVHDPSSRAHRTPALIACQLTRLSWAHGMQAGRVCRADASWPGFEGPIGQLAKQKVGPSAAHPSLERRAWPPCS